jgi:5-methylcytosine-specific restriction endonuclease McrA
VNTCFVCGDEVEKGQFCKFHDKGEIRKIANKIIQENKRAQKLGLVADLTFDQYWTTLEYFTFPVQTEAGQKVGVVCTYCGNLYEKTYYSIDHWIATSRGGGTTVSNCVPACGMCNEIKSAWSGDDFFKVLKILRSEGSEIRYQHALKYFDALKNGTLEELTANHFKLILSAIGF